MAIIFGIIATLTTVILRYKKYEKPLSEKPTQLSLLSSLHNQTPPEPNFVGRGETLKTITNWYKNPNVHIGALIGWGGFGKSALVRKWYGSLMKNKIKPDGIFWWGFYRNPYLERFLEELLRYLSQGRIDLSEVKTSWQKVERIKEFITEREYLIVLDGLEVMQKEEGEEFGAMKDREFQEILRFIVDSDFKGLCLITTRFPMEDIETYSSYQSCGVEGLSKEDTKLLFQKIGVMGNDDEIDAVWDDFKGHTLSLVLLANYLGKGGDIKEAREIPPFYKDEEAGGKAHRMLLWYDKQLNENQRQFMKIFSLFRQAIGEAEFNEVFLKKIKMEPFHFKRMVDNLYQRRLISKGPGNTYTTTPLIKSYFEAVFDEEEKKACHKSIYEYFGKIAKDLPKTLEEMQPLFEQVYYGTSAGLYDEVCEDVYWEKIYRRNEYFITYKLGAWETNLSLLKNFFPKGEVSRMPLVGKKSNRNLLLNEVGLSLLASGRAKEAEKSLKAAINLCIEEKQSAYVSVGYRHLVDLQFRIGELEKGHESAKKALEMAEKAKSDEYLWPSKSYLAWILHLLGKDKEAGEWFKQADELSREISGYRLHNLHGTFYADFLVSIKRIDEALELIQANLEICQKNNWLAGISNCHRSLASIKRIKGNHKETESHLQKALEIARKVGIPALEIEILLESVRLDLDMKKYEDATHKANETLKLVTRTGFRFYEPEAELILAKAYLAQGDKSQAKSYAQSAHEKARAMHYKIMENESANLLAGVHVKFVGKR